MNILVPKNWLLEIAKTNLSSKDIEHLLSEKSSSVEKIEKIEGDDVFDIEVTQNRSDNLGVIGIARELNAICKYQATPCEFINPLKVEPLIPVEGGNKKLNIKIADPKINPRFYAVVIDNVKIKKSPDFIQKRLIQSGVRPINNVVDITNYIMLETTQPMHAFDYTKIKNGEMFVTTTKGGEELITLDGVKRALPQDSIIIKDSEKIYDLCGIMGGQNSEIDENSKTIILFTQIYDRVLVRKTSMTLNLRTRAVQHFEKGIDRTIQLKALFRALELLKKSTDFQISSTIYDVNYTKYKPIQVTMSFLKLETYSNCKISKETCKKILESLEFKIENLTEKFITVTVPSHREGDIKMEEDLIEEIVRIYGYNNIQNALPTNSFSKDMYIKEPVVERLVKNYLKSIGFNEVLTYSMVSENLVNLKKAIKIDNPMGREMEYLRTNHEKPLVSNLPINKKVNLFEISNIYIKQNDNLPKEILRLCLISNSKGSYAKVNNVIKNIFKLLNIYNYKLVFYKNSAKIIINKRHKGTIKYNKSYTYLQVNFKNLVENYSEYPVIKSVKQAQKYIEDFTILIPKDYYFENLKNKILEVDKNIAQIKFKDEYSKNNKKALTINVTYQNFEKDLTTMDAKKIREKILDFVKNKLKLTTDTI